MTEQKLQKLTYHQQRATGWHLCRLGGLPSHSSKGPFNRVVRTYGYRCFNCRVVNPFLTIDHIIPKSKHGTSNIDNLRLLCLADHRKKDNKVRKVKSHEDINLVSCISTR